MEAVYNAVPLLQKVLFYMFDACQCFFCKEKLLRMNQYWHCLELIFFNYLQRNTKMKAHVYLCLMLMTNITKVIGCPAFTVVSSVAYYTLEDRSRQPFTASILRTPLKIQNLNPIFSFWLWKFIHLFLRVEIYISFWLKMAN